MLRCSLCKGGGVAMVDTRNWGQCPKCKGLGYVPDPQIEALIGAIHGVEDRLSEIRDVERSKT